MRGPVRGRLSSRLGRVLWAPAALVMLAAAVTARPASAQDCSIGRDGWDDIQRFRDCIEEQGLDAWSPWVLHQAAEYTGNPTIVRLLLQAGADPNAPDDNGLPPLHWGAETSNPMVVIHLLDASTDLNARDKEGYTALHWAAAQSGNGRVVKVLLDRGADPFAESNDGRTPLHSALRYRADPSVVSRMLDAGADEHLTPLQLSALQGDEMAVNRLLAGGADPNETDRYGWGPLHFAVPLAGLEVVSALLAAGATVTAGAAGQRVVIDMESDNVDAYLRVLRKDGTPVATDDDGGSGSNGLRRSKIPDRPGSTGNRIPKHLLERMK